MPLEGPRMLIKVISLAFDSVRGNFDDTPLREFLKDKEILSISDHFFMKGRNYKPGFLAERY